VGSERRARLALLAGSVAATLLAGEIALRLLGERHEPDPRFVPVERLCEGCRRLFELNPSHPAVSPQKTRDRVVEIPKPPGTFRILLLGDSIALGQQVRRSETFAQRLELALDSPERRVEVVNAGVNGYTPYNELHYFLEVGRSFEPDLVLAAFCMNDVVDPLLHWNRRRRLLEVPAEAIPNPAYHEAVAEPRFRRRMWAARAASHSALLGRLAALLVPSVAEDWRERCYRTRDGRQPDCLTLEDELGIEVLLDEESPEWRWLRGQYDQLSDAVREAGASLAVLVFPLAYQMDPEYPHRPQAPWERYCRARGLACLDLLPAFRVAAARAAPPADPEHYDALWIDVWHPSPAGHAVAAEAIRAFLGREGLLGR
jgi:lysophospholipase L1-like esterase